MGGQTEGHVERGLRGKEITRQAHGQTDRQMDKHKDRQTDRQTDFRLMDIRVYRQTIFTKKLKSHILIQHSLHNSYVCSSILWPLQSEPIKRQRSTKGTS